MVLEEILAISASRTTNQNPKMGRTPQEMDAPELDGLHLSLDRSDFSRGSDVSPLNPLPRKICIPSWKGSHILKPSRY